MRLLDHIDSVYFLLIPGWETELRANRWHFALRWAKRKPVVLVSAVLRGGPAVSVPEARIPNCRILRTQLVSEPNQLAKAEIQLGQVLDDMARHRFVKPLLWCYDPELVELYARVPAIARVHHATENFFDMPGRGSGMHQHLRATVAVSDVTVAVSDGVASALRKRVDGADVITVTNGCDFTHYSAGKPDDELLAAGRSYARIAIYAGNINGRLDFDLLDRLAETNPRALFAFYGPVKELSSADTTAWKAVTQMPNVLAPGAVDPDRLRDLYAAADVGLIPYRQDAWLVENGMPLKALEMAATGLPVVSTLMKPLQGLARGLVVTSSRGEFMEAFQRTSRSALTSEEVGELTALSAANDYDVKFDAIVDALEQRVSRTEAVTRVDRLAEVLGAEWTDAQIRYARWLAMPPAARAAGRIAGSLALMFPARWRRRLGSGRLRAAVRQWLGS